MRLRRNMIEYWGQLQFWRWWIAGLGLGSWGLAVLGAIAPPAPRTNAPPTVLRIPQSIFIDDPAQNGKDPFFPNSTRRAQFAAAAAPDLNVVSSKVSANLVLKGIVMGSKGRRMALINNQVFEIGETKTNAFAIDGIPVSVRCAEIREDSVAITIAGKSEQYELPIRKPGSASGGP